MDAASPNPPDSWPEQIALLRGSKRWLRVIGYLALIYLLTPFVLGILFMMALFPLTLAFARLAMIFTPAYRLVGRALGVEPLPDRLARPPIMFIIASAIYILFGVAVAGLCIWLLFYSGFCNQNLLCLEGTRQLFNPPIVK